MPLAMNREVFITCAVTGSGGSQDRSPHVPRSPQQIADSAIDAAKAGAAIVHCHVRDPETGVPCRDTKLFREVTDRIRVGDDPTNVAWLTGDKILVTTGDGTALVVDTTVDLIALARETVGRSLTERECGLYLEATCAEWEARYGP